MHYTGSLFMCVTEVYALYMVVIYVRDCEVYALQGRYLLRDGELYAIQGRNYICVISRQSVGADNCQIK